MLTNIALVSIGDNASEDIIETFRDKIKLALESPDKKVLFNVFNSLIERKLLLKHLQIDLVAQNLILSEGLATLETSTMATVTDAKDTAGKLIYTNDSKRKAAAALILDALPDYKQFNMDYKQNKLTAFEIDMSLSVVRSYMGFIENN